MILVLLAALASADCPWKVDDYDTVRSDMTTVSVGGRRIDVRGKASREDFIATLQACELSAAVAPFEAWRKARRWTNTWGVVGCVTVVGGFLPIALTGPKANRERLAMEDAIRWAGDERE